MRSEGRAVRFGKKQGAFKKEVETKGHDQICRPKPEPNRFAGKAQHRLHFPYGVSLLNACKVIINNTMRTPNKGRRTEKRPLK